MTTLASGIEMTPVPGSSQCSHGNRLSRLPSPAPRLLPSVLSHHDFEREEYEHCVYLIVETKRPHSRVLLRPFFEPPRLGARPE